MNTETVAARSAIESLRSGVPSRDAAQQLGTTQQEIRDRFTESLDSVAEGRGVSPIVISATFGAGKTHLLNYLQTLAEREGFVTSYGVISPEMPLGNSHLVVKAMAEAARAPGQTGKAVRALAATLKTESEEYKAFQEWANTAKIDEKFRALIRLYEAYRADEEFRVQILNDFEGRAILKTIMKNRLKQIGEAAAYDLSGPRSALLAHDRVRLLAQFFKASGCKGWVVLFDEMERVAKFSVNQRLAAYSELGWWREAAELTGSALLPVFTTASGFVAESVTGGARDEQRLSSSSEERDTHARSGIELLKSPFRLESPTPEQEEEIRYRVKAIYEEAYGAPIADLPAARGDVRISIRSEIRRWITQWDMQRYYPSYQPDLAVDEVLFDQSEIAEDITPGDDADEAGE
ncbi:MAG: BREX system ATP-binding domain-containing protein [Capsulimonas sp.]|uniref:BREX system ATP-binding domain-containing protein n=1 Tax=Capsulimonas sp. TaxID=2494211 RepID=UPI003264493C